MKKTIYIVLAAIATISFTSCKKYLDDVKTSPNSPEVASPRVLLSSIEMATFANYTGNNARRSATLVQQIVGTGFQMIDVNNYIVLEGDVDNDWQTIYQGAIINAQLLINDFGADNPHYAGIAKVLKAMNLGLATDMWGDVPSKDASKGVENLNPIYESQQVVYGDIQSILTEAIGDMNKPVSANKLLPGDEDYMFAGDVAQWIKTAWVLKARYANRLSNKSAAASAADAISYLNSAYAAGFTGNSDDANAIFGTAGNESNQWYIFNSTRADYVKMGAFLIDTMNATSDPRIHYYADSIPGSGYVGGDLANPDPGASSDIGVYLDVANTPAPLVTYVEAKFIEAEAKLRSGDAAGAASAHNSAVKASLLAVTGSPDATYEAAYASLTSTSISLSKIMTAKYVALFSQIESWTDWRRTGFPALTVNPAGAINGIPKRLPTALNERTYNTNALVNSNLLSAVWFQ